MRPVLLVALLFCGCATFKPLPGQTLTCIENATPGAFIAAGTAIAQHETADQIKQAGIGIGEGILECEALAIWADVTHAQTLALAAGTDAQTVQAHARTYLQARGITVTAN